MTRILILFFLPGLLLPMPLSAQTIQDGLTDVAKQTFKKPGNTSEESVAAAIGDVIAIILGLVGVFFFILLSYGGILWMTSRGNDDAVSKAQKIITSAVIGIIIALSAYVLTNFINAELFTKLDIK